MVIRTWRPQPDDSCQQDSFCADRSFKVRNSEADRRQRLPLTLAQNQTPAEAAGGCTDARRSFPACG